jgi:alcohol dehydrogenase class IV
MMHELIEAFTLPRWIEAKPGCIGGVGAWAGKFGTRAFVCTGRSAARKAGLLERVEKSLKAESVEYEIFDGIPAEPLIETAEQGAVLAKKKACDVFIGLGGGSVLDTVKLVAMLQENPLPAEDYQLGKRELTRPCKPVISIPMTAGTGSEATKVSVMTNPGLKVKKAVYSWEMVSTVALLDAEATVGLPPELTRDTGLDALGQAIEGYLSTACNAITAAAGAQAVRLVRDNLPLAVAEGKNIQARHNMLVASLLGGLAIDTGVGLGHEMAMAVGSYKGLSHGLLVGVLTPWCLEANLGWADQKIAELAYHFRCPHSEDPTQQARALIGELFEFARRLDLPPSLGTIGISREEIDPILEASKLSTNIQTNPRPLDDQVRKAVLEKAIEG